MSAKNHPRRKRLGRVRRDGHFEARCKKQIPERGDENLRIRIYPIANPNSIVKNRSPKEGTKTRGRSPSLPLFWRRRKKQIPERGDENFFCSSATFFSSALACKKQIPERGDENYTFLSALRQLGFLM